MSGFVRYIEVGKEERYEYHNIQDAIDACDESDYVTVIIHEGIYMEALDIPSHTNIVGVDAEKCIICNDTGKYKNAAIKCIGDFNIQNITFKMLMPPITKWQPSYDFSNVTETFPRYAMHIIDGPVRNERQSIATIRNCRFYSETFPCVGMGLRNNQIVLFDDCSFERVIKDEIYNHKNYDASFFCHASNKKSDLNSELILDNCRFVGKGCLAMLLGGTFRVAKECQ